MTYEHWAWVVQEPDGVESIIAVAVAEGDPPELRAVGPMMTLISRSERLARGPLAEFARRHGEALGRPVRLVHLREVAD